MKFKKHISTFLAVAVLIANIGFSFTIHYCKDKIASISLVSNFDSPKSKSVVSCCKVKDNSQSCCSNKVVKVEKKQDNFIDKTLKFESSIAVLNNISYNFFNKEIFISVPEKTTYYCQNNSPPLYKLNCQLVFYA